jgi:hypothetical protein
VHCSHYTATTATTIFTTATTTDTTTKQPPIVYAAKGIAPAGPMNQAMKDAEHMSRGEKCQIIICIKPTKDVADYALIKAASDTVLGVPSLVNTVVL